MKMHNGELAKSTKFYLQHEKKSNKTRCDVAYL